ncbi:MAG: hypothetical protein LQ338_001992 [Usnochroma carphineum]|nr:MAG: hypothetical protein LQ338_001992 [Usnochroma carphineum]
MPQSMVDREALTSRSIPSMTLSTGDAASMTGPPPPMPHYLTAEGRAVKRFAVEGNAIMTGGAGTLALANARALLEHGLIGLALFDLNPAHSAEQIGILQQDFPDARIITQTVNVTNAEQVQQAVAKTVLELGSIDILCCFAGVVGCAHAIDMTPEEWRRTLDINTTGSFLCAQAVAKNMIAANIPGSILFVASISAHRVNFPQPQIAYNASKAALLSIKSSLAAEWARYGIRVNTISPGYMDTVLNEGDGLDEARRTWTGRNPMGRMGQPEELTGPVVMLCSSAGSYITGADLVVDGVRKSLSVEMDAKKFVQLFGEILAPDTARVKAATATLKAEYYPHPQSLSILIQLLVSDESTSLRQLAASQARLLVSKHWKKLPDEQKPAIRQHLLQKTLSEEAQLVRHGAARVITAIAKIDLETGQWPDLFDTLVQAAGSKTPRHREVGTYILFTTIEDIGEEMTAKIPQLIELFANTINDPQSAEVKVNSMLALSRIAIILDSEDDAASITKIENLIPQMVGVLKQAIDAEDEDRTTQSFEVFQTLLGCDSSVLNKHFKDLVQFMTNIAADTDADEEARTQALSFLMQCVRLKKLRIQGLRVGEQLTLKCLEIVTEMGDEDESSEEVTTARSALALIDVLAESLPPSQVVVPLLHHLGAYVNSPDPDRRKAGILALGTCVEGAPDFINTQLHEILPLVLRLFDDREDKVRRAALDTIMRLAEDLAEDLGKEHAKLIPALVKHLDMAVRQASGPDDAENLNTIKACCNALDTLSEGLDAETMKQYLPELVPRLSRLFTHSNFKIRAAAIGALGAIGATSEEAFSPYFEPTMNSLSDYVRIKDSEEELDLRCTTCDAMGAMALAVGAKAFQRYVRPLMEATEEGLHLDHPKLRETSFLFWGNMAKVYKDEFKPFLEGVVKAIFESLQSEESELEVDLGEEAADLAGKEVTIGGKKVKVSAFSDDELAAASDIEDLDGMEDGASDDSDWDDLQAVTAVAQEKEIAAEVVGDIVTHVTRPYIPYIEKTVEVVLPLTAHSYEGVRRAAIGTLYRLYAAVWELQPEELQKWEPGLPLKQKPTDEVAKLGELITTSTIAIWGEEEDRATVTDINRNLATTLNLTGPSLLSLPSTITAISQTLLKLLSRTHPCQTDFSALDNPTPSSPSDSDLDPGALESSEYDWLVIDTALDVLVSLAHVLGAQFAEFFKLVEKTLFRFASGSEAFERSTAVGVLAECIRSMGDAVTPYTTALFKVLMHRLNDEDAEAKSNAVFAVGLLVANSGDEKEVGRHFNTVLARLEPMLGEEGARLRDNAAGCVARMVMRYQGKVPLGAVVPALVDVLPLKEDFEENEPVWECVVRLYSAGEPTILGLTPQLLPILEKVLGPPEEQLTEMTREQVVEMVKFVHGKRPGMVEAYPGLKGVVRG